MAFFPFPSSLEEQINNLLEKSAFSKARNLVKTNDLILMLEEKGYSTKGENNHIYFIKNIAFENGHRVKIAFFREVIEYTVPMTKMKYSETHSKCVFYIYDKSTNEIFDTFYVFDIALFNEEDVNICEEIIEFVLFFVNGGSLLSETANIFFIRYLDPSKICLSATIEVCYKKESIYVDMKVPGKGKVVKTIKFKEIKNLGPREVFKQTISDVLNAEYSPLLPF